MVNFWEMEAARAEHVALDRPSPAAISPADILAQIVKIDGASFQFGPAYHANLEGADRMRAQTAKRLARACQLERDIYFEKLSLYRAGAEKCSWCECALTDLRTSRVIGSVMVHLACGVMFDDWRERRVEIAPAGRAALSEESPRCPKCHTLLHAVKGARAVYSCPKCGAVGVLSTDDSEVA